MTAISNSFDKEKRKYPDAFYCNLTNELLKDPVVAPDGKSYERDVILTTGNYQEDELYLNRALKSVIEEGLEMNGDSIESELLRYRRFFQESFQGMLENTPIPTENICPLPEGYYCPITFDLMHVPVIDKEGYTFEKVAIESWVIKNNSSPISRNTLSIETLYPNHAISSLLEYEKNKPDEFMNPSIRKFKEEPPPQASSLCEESHATSQVQSSSRDLFPTTPEQLYAEHEDRAWQSMFRKWKVFMVILIIPAYSYGRTYIYFVFALLTVTLVLLRCYHKMRFRYRPQDIERFYNRSERQSQRQLWIGRYF